MIRAGVETTLAACHPSRFNGKSIIECAVYSCCMSATRTQVYLTETQRRRMDNMARAKGVPMAEIVRRALDAYLGSDIDPSVALANTFGAHTDAEVPSRASWRRG